MERLIPCWVLWASFPISHHFIARIPGSLYHWQTHHLTVFILIRLFILVNHSFSNYSSCAYCVWGTGWGTADVKTKKKPLNCRIYEKKITGTVMQKNLYLFFFLKDILTHILEMLHLAWFGIRLYYENVTAEKSSFFKPVVFKCSCA